MTLEKNQLIWNKRLGFQKKETARLEFLNKYYKKRLKMWLRFIVVVENNRKRMKTFASWRENGYLFFSFPLKRTKKTLLLF